MNLNISREWLLRMAEKEGNGIISVGGLAYRMIATEEVPTIDVDIKSQTENLPADRLGEKEKPQ